MRIIAGKAGRRPIHVPRSLVRPTTDRVREALFSMLMGVIEDARVLDLFAGSGANGLEALSRGAKECVFVDENSMSVRTIEKNLSVLKLDGGQVMQADVISWVKRAKGRQAFDLVIADPPYKKDFLDRDYLAELMALPMLGGVVAKDGWLVLEADAKLAEMTTPGWTLQDQRTYGGCALWFYQKQRDGEGD